MQMMQTTEIAVCITDQDLMVCPTVRPAYSLTSDHARRRSEIAATAQALASS